MVNSLRNRSRVIAGSWGLVIGVGIAVVAPAASQADVAAIQGLDHVPVAVADLEAAAARFKDLGFSLKPGQPHANGIRNQHVKFSDGTEVELITAPTAVDALTSQYRKHLESGDGPAFLAFYATDAERLAAALTRAGQPFTRTRNSIDIDDADPLGYIFFGPRNQSPTDRPEHFAHPNSAEQLTAVWLAAPDLSRERRMLTASGARLARQDVRVPERVSADVAHVGDGEVRLLEGRRQAVPGRKIVGVTLRVRTLAVARQWLTDHGFAKAGGVVDDGSGSLFVPPALAHGLWIELREGR